jgi:hypothetical protein
MDLIERLFGLAPDGGDGSLEALIFVVILAVLAGVVGYRRRSRDHGISDRD